LKKIVLVHIRYRVIKYANYRTQLAIMQIIPCYAMLDKQVTLH
jgi:hypothetical protein